MARPLRAIADGEGDEVTFCGTCAFAPVCLPNGYDKVALAELHCLIEHVGPFAPGHVLFRRGDPFGAVYAVRAGAVKTSVVDEHGREQVLGFYFPGELVGLSGIYPDQYPCDAVALDTLTVCRFSFPAMATLATRMPGIQATLFRLMSKDIGDAALLAGDFTADERLAAFLVRLSQRQAARGFSATQLHLPMTRTDIANYLRLAPETVSRVLRRFVDDGLIVVDRREVALAQRDALDRLARPVLRTDA
ncbi:MAG TPA: helix-turn-helix domain-containing protein [Xanthomonadales bacterium]|nr:helix-turn-helix domain-containing protein [Xanthomonadales bacterium]